MNEIPMPPPALVAPMPAPKLAQRALKPVKVFAMGWHVHRCPLCATEWSHHETSRGSVKDHQCPAPGCTGHDWIPRQTNTKIVLQ